MGDSDDSNGQAAGSAAPVPSWQQAASRSQPAEDHSSETSSSESILDKARIFLQEEEVRNESKEKKIEFLKSKGLDEAAIAQLLDETSHVTASSTTTATATATADPTPSVVKPQTTSFEPTESGSQPSGDVQQAHPPIVTYPEFLTKPTKPPPLITASGLLNALTIIGGASTLAYGATKHLVSPMVAALTAARVDLHQSADASLSRLVTALEGAVSEIPASYYTASGSNNKKSITSGTETAGAAAVDKDDASDSSYDDPSELFHRDIGVQTSPPAPSTPLYNSSFNPNTNTKTPSTSIEKAQHHADRLSRIAVAGRNLAADLVRQTEDLSETKNVLDILGSDLHTLTYPPESFAGGSSAYLYGAAAAARSEPDDEIKRAKTNIRAVKGVLLSTKNFPASTR